MSYHEQHQQVSHSDIRVVATLKLWSYYFICFCRKKLTST